MLLDSLNRHMLGSYGGDEFATPNLDRIAARSVRFTSHFTGSLPCMPARHDILCGAYDFLWKPWGSIELWEDAITYPLRRSGVVTQLVSDHPHLFETGGENYHTDFTGWEYLRGHAGDTWKTVADPSWAGAPSFRNSVVTPEYERNRGWFRGEDDFPGPRTMAAAAEWLDHNAGKHDRFMLFVDEFDPHEPLDTPEPWASMYDPEWEGPNLIHPPYTKDAVADGVVTEREARQIRACYGAKLSMIDHWFGKVLDAVDRNDLWHDTAVLVCTDHGLYLGEHDVFGKPGVPVHEPMGHIPLLVAWPGVAPRTCDALTTNVDIHATVADVFDVSSRQRTHGCSLRGLVEGSVATVRDTALTGVWGSWVHLVDGEHTYARAPREGNRPISMWSNRWSTMPTRSRMPKEVELPYPDGRAYLDRMPGSDIPVLRQPWEVGDHIPFWSAWTTFDGNHLWNIREDPAQRHDLAGSPVEKELADRLRDALVEIDAPDDQLVRLGLH